MAWSRFTARSLSSTTRLCSSVSHAISRKLTQSHAISRNLTHSRMHVLTQARKTAAVLSFGIITRNMTRLSFCFAVCVRARSFLLLIICRLLGAVRPGVSARAAARAAQQRRRNPDRRCQVLHGQPPPTIPVGSCRSFLACAAFFDVHSRRGIRYRQTELADLFSCRDRAEDSNACLLACLLASLLHWTHVYICVIYLRGTVTWYMYLLTWAQASGGYRVVVRSAQRARLLRGHHERHYARVCRVSGALTQHSRTHALTSSRTRWEGRNACDDDAVQLKNVNLIGRSVLRLLFALLLPARQRRRERVRKTPLSAPFTYKMHHFTKTGSGQT
jgi:hypothetical protein